jgi:hypothetical protein
VRSQPEQRRRNSLAHSTEAPARLDVSDAEFVIGQTGDWIRSADTKAGLLFGALAVLSGWLGSSAEGLRGLWSGQPHQLDALIALAGCVVLLAVANVLLVGVLIPRRSTDAATRYAWPSVSKKSLDDLLALTPETRREEAWKQAKQLAEIASRKHDLFAVAVWFSIGSVLCFLTWSVLRP